MKSRGVSILDLGPAALAQVKDQLLAQAPAEKARKYRNEPTFYKSLAGHERTYDSKKEAHFAADLDTMKRAGEIVYWLPQVRIPLPGKGLSYVADFMVCKNGFVTWYDVKGMDTPVSSVKRKLVLAIYGIEVVTV